MELHRPPPEPTTGPRGPGPGAWPKGLLAPILIPFAGLWLRRQAKRCRDLGALLDLAFAFRAFGFRIAPFQVRGELEALLGIVAELRPRRILEIGTARGGTLFLLARVAAPDAQLISLDLPPGPPAYAYASWREGLYRSFAVPGQRLHVLRGDSHQAATAARVSAALDGGALDFLLIDGDHSYEGARLDWQMYSPLVRPGGLIAFHDIVPGPAERVGGVPRLWRELRGTGRSHELVESWQQGGYGIGLVSREAT